MCPERLCRVCSSLLLGPVVMLCMVCCDGLAPFFTSLPLRTPLELQVPLFLARAAFSLLSLLPFRAPSLFSLLASACCLPPCPFSFVGLLCCSRCRCVFWFVVWCPVASAFCCVGVGFGLFFGLFWPSLFVVFLFVVWWAVLALAH